MGSMSHLPTPTTQVSLFVLPAAALRTGHGVSWLAYVGIAEQVRAAEFKNPDDALAFATQHTLMRCIAATVLGIKATAAADIPLDRTCRLCGQDAQHGKPRITGMEFNMSRTQGMVAGAVTRSSTSLGVDIERIRGSYFSGFDRIALTPQEKEALASLPESAAQVVRHLLWTAKEAVLKATGHGLAAGPSSVELDVSALPKTFESATAFYTRAVLSLPGEAFRVFEVSWQVIDGDYVLALASDGGHRVNLHRVSTPLEVRRQLERAGN